MPVVCIKSKQLKLVHWTEPAKQESYPTLIHSIVSFTQSNNILLILITWWHSRSVEHMGCYVFLKVISAVIELRVKDKCRTVPVDVGHGIFYSRGWCHLSCGLYLRKPSIYSLFNGSFWPVFISAYLKLRLKCFFQFCWCTIASVISTFFFFSLSNHLVQLPQCAQRLNSRYIVKLITVLHLT